MHITPPCHIVWSTDSVDLSDPFQRRWYIRKVLLQGRSEDIHTLGLEGVATKLDDLDLPLGLYQLWKTFLEKRTQTRNGPDVQAYR